MVMVMLKNKLILASVLSIMSGLFFGVKKTTIPSITYEICDIDFQHLRMVKEKMLKDYYQLANYNVRQTHQNLMENYILFQYEENYQISYENYHLRIICEEKYNCRVQGFLFQQEIEEINKTYFFK